MSTLPTDAPITPLRQRMQHDMLMRGLGSHTQEHYVRHARRFACSFGVLPPPSLKNALIPSCALNPKCDQNITNVPSKRGSLPDKVENTTIGRGGALTSTQGNYH